MVVPAAPQPTSDRPWLLLDYHDGVLNAGPWAMSAVDVLNDCRRHHENTHTWRVLVDIPTMRVVEDLTAPKYGYVRHLIFVKVL